MLHLFHVFSLLSVPKQSPAKTFSKVGRDLENSLHILLALVSGDMINALYTFYLFHRTTHGSTYPNKASYSPHVFRFCLFPQTKGGGAFSTLCTLIIWLANSPTLDSPSTVPPKCLHEKDLLESNSLYSFVLPKFWLLRMPCTKHTSVVTVEKLRLIFQLSIVANFLELKLSYFLLVI